MTIDDFLAYKYTLYYYASELTSKLYSDMSTGRNTTDDDAIRLKSLLVYIKIVNEYEMTSDVEDDFNMFTREEMKTVTNHINKLVGTNYNIDLVLEE